MYEHAGYEHKYKQGTSNSVNKEKTVNLSPKWIK